MTARPLAFAAAYLFATGGCHARILLLAWQAAQPRDTQCCPAAAMPKAAARAAAALAQTAGNATSLSPGAAE